MTPERLVLDTNIVIDLCQRIDMGIDTGRVAGQYANQFSKAFQGISLEDYVLAATARTQRCPLWTHNRKYYPMDDIELLTA